mmetsp:Transcript_68190/g.220352  ORF Transcript_68190/g.220352 Transcript_68190/m.220352 type:complete len:241 (+) Transcript_68190:158-880(+)
MRLCIGRRARCLPVPRTLPGGRAEAATGRVRHATMAGGPAGTSSHCWKVRAASQAQATSFQATPVESGRRASRHWPVMLFWIRPPGFNHHRCVVAAQGRSTKPWPPGPTHLPLNRFRRKPSGVKSHCCSVPGRPRSHGPSTTVAPPGVAGLLRTSRHLLLSRFTTKPSRSSCHLWYVPSSSSHWPSFTTAPSPRSGVPSTSRHCRECRCFSLPSGRRPHFVSWCCTGSSGCSQFFSHSSS